MSPTALQSDHSLLQEKADDERDRAANMAVRKFLLESIAPMIRVGRWQAPEPENYSAWPHWDALSEVVGNFYMCHGWNIDSKKKLFVRRVHTVFRSLVLTKKILAPCHGSIATALRSSLDQGGSRDATRSRGMALSEKSI